MYLSLLPATAAAGVVSSTSAIEVIDAPASVRQNALESNSQIRVFLERSNFEVLSPFQINGTGPKVFDSFGAYQDRRLPVGTHFDSYFVHIDTLGNSSAIVGPGEITFSTPVIGIVGRDPHLIETSAIVGAPGTAYPTTRNSQHFDFNNNPDTFTLLPDGHSVRILSQAGLQQDQFRILVAPAVPEPSAGGILASGLLVVGWLRKRPTRR